MSIDGSSKLLIEMTQRLSAAKVPCLASPLPRQEMEGAVDPDGDEGHEVRPAVGTNGREPVRLPRLAIRDALAGNRPGCRLLLVGEE